MAIVTNVYWGDSSGGPVDYGTVVDVVAGPPWTWTTPTPLAPGEHRRFGLRNFDTFSGLDDAATDAEVVVIVAADGTDVSARPAPVSGLAAAWDAALPGLRVSWSYLWPGSGPRDFVVRATPGTVPDFAAALDASVPFRAGVSGYAAALPDLPAGPYAVSVRARDIDGLEDGSTVFVSVAVDTVAPTAVTSLIATAVSGRV